MMIKRRLYVAPALTVVATALLASVQVRAEDGTDAGAAGTRGQALFRTYCAACHQANGNGVTGVFPTLKGNAVVNRDDATKHIQVVLRGEPAGRVSGVVYSSPMPAFGEILGDAEVVDIINYERSAWGNHGKPVDAAQVSAQRSITK